ncbi:MAG: hypothetical protein QME47_02470 [Candidatus Thermoplasmatota archaeon]|nr:hypothetical protein [Candidatus Thermoplasmatota archaeon]
MTGLDKALCAILASFLVIAPISAFKSNYSEAAEVETFTKGLVEDKLTRVTLDATVVRNHEIRELLVESLKPSPVSGVRATNNYQSPSTVIDPNNNIHVVFEHWTGSEWDVVYAKSTDDGYTWALGTFTRAGNQRNPRIGICGNALLVVSEDPQYFIYWKSTNWGATWDLYGYAGSEWWANAKWPSMSINGSWIYVASQYWNGTWWVIRMRYSSNSGAGWSTHDVTIANQNLRHPSVALNAIRVNLGFHTGTETSGTNICFSRADLGSTSYTLDYFSGSHEDMAIAASGVYVYYAWTRYYSATDDDIGVKWSTDSGATISTNTRLVGGTENERFASITINSTDSGAHLTFANTDTNNVWYTFSAKPSAVGFGGREINTVAGSANSTYRFCDVAINRTNIASTVWTDTRDGGVDVYFCKYVDVNVRIAPSVAVSYYTLPQGWNFITLTLSNASLNSASALASAIGDNCTHVANWTSSGFVTYIKGVLATDFTLELGRGYMVYIVNSTTNFTIEGSEVASVKILLNEGWANVGLLNSTLAKASDLASAIGNCSAVACLDNSLARFVVHQVGEELSNFNLEVGKGYLVFMEVPKTWTQNV